MKLFGSLLVAFAVSLLALAGTANAAGPDRSVLVLPVEFDGDRQKAMEPRLENSLRVGIERGEVPLVSAQDVPALEKMKGSCDDACLRESFEQSGAAFAVRARILLAKRNYTIALEVVSAEDLSVEAKADAECEICGQREALDFVSDQGARIAQQLEKLLRGRAMLVVESTPENASVFVDGELIGTTPLRSEVPTGSHEVRIELLGHIGQTRTIEGVRGVDGTLELELQPMPLDDVAGAAARKKAGRMTAIGGVGLGAGLVAVGGGIPLIVIHNEQNQRRCSGDEVDVNGLCKYSYDTRGGGIAAVAAGSAISIAGAVLLVMGLRKTKRLGNAAAFIVPGGTGLSLRF